LIGFEQQASGFGADEVLGSGLIGKHAVSAVAIAAKELFGNTFVICMVQGLNTNVRGRQRMSVFQL
jgi:hypothetical protein